MKEVYRAYLVWKEKDDEAVRLAWQAVIGSPMIIKCPIADRWAHDQMIITNIMTDERKERLKLLTGRRLRVLKKPPFGWWPAGGMTYG